MSEVLVKLHTQPDQYTYQQDGFEATALDRRISAERYALDRIKVKPLKLSLNKTASPNHLVIQTQYWKALQSYDTVVAVTNRIRYDVAISSLFLKVDLDPVFWDFSRTTKRYLLDFLGTFEDELRSDIKQGNVNLVRLNPAGHSVERADGKIISYPS
tara:strand:+ start:2078 stop:2548 length:471 start_codon:yes stop_codon:yes gene_type:complete